MNISYKFIKIPNLLFFKGFKPRVYSNTITKMIKNSTYSGNGSFGIYMRISNSKGIKLLYYEFETMKSALDSLYFKEAIEEARLLEEGKRRYSNIPTCYGVRIIWYERRYRIGIVMQYLEGTVVQNIPDFTIEMRNVIKEELKNKGIFHRDLHHENIIFADGKYWVIDFTPSNISIETH